MFGGRHCRTALFSLRPTVRAERCKNTRLVRKTNEEFKVVDEEVADNVCVIVRGISNPTFFPGTVGKASEAGPHSSPKAPACENVG